jgi:hypothetical protein
MVIIAFAVIFYVALVFCSVRLKKEMRDMDIVELNPLKISISGLILYYQTKKKNNEPLSINFYATVALQSMLLVLLVVFTIYAIW